MTPAHIEAIAERLYEHDRAEYGFRHPAWKGACTTTQARYRARAEAIDDLVDALVARVIDVPVEKVASA